MDWNIELQDWMKLNSFVATGGEAKLAIQAGEVTVNGEVETRRRRKLHEKDVVEYAGKRGVVERERT
jgi:ribosome-associated protein